MKSVNSVPMEDIGDIMPKKAKNLKESKGIIESRTVKKFGNGGAFVSVPSTMIGQEVWVIPKEQIKGITVTLSH